MAEQSTRIADQRSGDYIATRDAVENDDGGNPRTIQLLDFSSRQFPYPHDIIRNSINTPDTVILDNLPVSLTDYLIDIGDKSLLVVDVEHLVSTGSVTITPIIFDDTGSNVVTIRASKTSAMGTAAFRKSPAGLFVSPQLTWDVQGAEKIGLHVTAISAGNAVIIYGGVI